MVKVRLIGLPTELADMIKALTAHFDILVQGEPVPCRDSKYFRVYMEIACYDDIVCGK